jgi:hypothetical protein
MSTAGLGLFGAANPEFKLVAPTKAVLDLTVNSYISTTGIIKESMTHEPHLSDNLEAHIQSSLNEFQRAVSLSIIADMRKFMEGEKNHFDQDLLTILKGEAFFRPRSKPYDAYSNTGR